MTEKDGGKVAWYRKVHTGSKAQWRWQAAIGFAVLFGAVIVPVCSSYCTSTLRETLRIEPSSVSKLELQRQVYEKRMELRRSLQESEEKK